MGPPNDLPVAASSARDDPYADDARDRAWVIATRGGDYAAFDAMFCAYADALCAYTYGFLRSPEDAQELVQDLFLWIWEHRQAWEVPGQLKTYLYRAVRNRAISVVRHRRVERLFSMRAQRHPDDEAALLRTAPRRADARLDATDLSAAAARALEDLPERCRQVFLLNRAHHLSYAQIAEVMKISPKTVEGHMARALAGLRQALGDWK